MGFIVVLKLLAESATFLPAPGAMPLLILAHCHSCFPVLGEQGNVGKQSLKRKVVC